MPWYGATIPRHPRTIPIGRILLVGVTLALWALPGFAGRGPGGEEVMRFWLFQPWSVRTSSADDSFDDGAMDIWRAVEVHRGSFVLTCAVQGVVVVGWLVARRVVEDDGA